MRIFNLSLVLSMVFFGLSAVAGNVDLAKSEVHWKGTKVVGSAHFGKVKLKSADITFKKNEPTMGNFVIDMNSITCEDLKDPQWNAKLIGHLKSDDFFSVEKYKTATFKADKFEKVSDKFYFVSGKLTIKGKTVDFKTKAEITETSKSHQMVKVDFKFDRTKFDIKYGSGSFFSNLGDKMISDEVEIKVMVKINKGQSVAKN